MTKFIEFFLKIILKKYTTDWFACGKDAGIEMWGEKSVNNNKVRIVNNAINLDKFTFNSKIREDYRRLLCVEDKKVIGCVGRLSDQKNQSFLLDVFKKVYERDNNVILLLVGRGELEEELKKKAKQLEIDEAVYFLGIRDDVEKILQALDVFVLPSKHEGLPVVLVEAQASGVKVIASDNITKEVEVTNLIEFVPVLDNAEVWTEKIIDSLEYERINTYTYLENMGFNIKKESIKLLSLYEELVNGGIN